MKLSSTARTWIGHIVVGSSLAWLLSSGTVFAAAPCFTEFHQIYEWHDDGRAWLNVLRPMCKSATLANDPGERGRSGGRLEIRVSGDDIYVHEDEYRWEVVHDAAKPCASARETHTRTTKVLLDGVYHELRERDGKPPRRTVKQGGRLSVGGVRGVPDLSKQQFADLGTHTIAGQSCRRVRATVGKESSVYCILDVPRSCAATRHLQPLEAIVGENSALRVDGMTLLLKIGERGRVLQKGAISPPP